MNLIERAQTFCYAAHGAIAQKRKYTNLEYYTHPFDVAETVRRYTDNENIIAAAYLHDVVEDTLIENWHVLSMFGPVIARYVSEVTDVSRPEDGNRAARKEIDRQHLANASWGGQLIKLADLIDNTKSIAQHDPKFARVYLKEKEALLEVLTKAPKAIHDEAVHVLNEAKKRVGMK